MTLETPAWYDPNDEALTPAKAAKVIGVSVVTLRRWIKKGTVSYIEIGPHKRKRIRRSECARHCVEHRVA